jgi:hypothetical protein
MKNARGIRDATLREFKERDLGGDIESAGTAVVARPQRPTSFRVELSGRPYLALRVRAPPRLVRRVPLNASIRRRRAASTR